MRDSFGLLQSLQSSPSDSLRRFSHLLRGSSRKERGSLFGGERAMKLDRECTTATDDLDMLGKRERRESVASLSHA